jgi:hypothetical protein
MAPERCTTTRLQETHLPNAKTPINDIGRTTEALPCTQHTTTRTESKNHSPCPHWKGFRKASEVPPPRNWGGGTDCDRHGFHSWPGHRLPSHRLEAHYRLVCPYCFASQAAFRGASDPLDEAWPPERRVPSQRRQVETNGAFSALFSTCIDRCTIPGVWHGDRSFHWPLLLSRQVLLSPELRQRMRAQTWRLGLTRVLSGATAVCGHAAVAPGPLHPPRPKC